MRILLICSSFHWAEGQIAHGIVSNRTDDEVFFFSKGEIPRRHLEFESLLETVDVVHWLFNVAYLSPQTRDLLHQPPGPTIATLHHLASGEEEKLEAASRCDAVHVVSEEWRLYVERNAPGTPLFLAHNGIDPADFGGISPLERSGGTFRIGVLGRYDTLHGRKRLDVLIAALKRLHETGANIELIVQGRGWEQHLSELRAQGLIVRSRGYRTRKTVSNFFNSIHCYVCTSDCEGGPLPVLEALQCGVPVVSTPVGLSLETLVRGGGILCEKDSPDQIADAIRSLIDDQELFERLRKEGPGIARDFHWCRLKPEFDSLYAGTIASWERKHGRRWELRHNKAAPAEKQRRRELMYDALLESDLLVKHDRLWAGLRTYFSAVLHPGVDLSRKADIGRRLLSHHLDGS